MGDFKPGDRVVALDDPDVGLRSRRVSDIIAKVQRVTATTVLVVGDISQDAIDNIASRFDVAPWWVKQKIRELAESSTTAAVSANELVEAMKPYRRWLTLRAQMRRKGKPGWRHWRGHGRG